VAWSQDAPPVRVRGTIESPVFVVKPRRTEPKNAGYVDRILKGESRPTCRSSRRLGTSWLSICANEPRASVSRLYRLISQQSEKLLYIGGDNGHQRVDLAEKMVVLVAVKYARSLNGKIERELLRRFAGTHLCYST
jgi:hypothetical protein